MIQNYEINGLFECGNTWATEADLISRIRKGEAISHDFQSELEASIRPGFWFKGWGNHSAKSVMTVLAEREVTDARIRQAAKVEAKAAAPIEISGLREFNSLMREGLAQEAAKDDVARELARELAELQLEMAILREKAEAEAVKPCPAVRVAASPAKTKT